MTEENGKRKRSLEFSFLDGIFAAGMVGFTQDYFAPFLLVMGGTARHIGMLSAMPNLFSSLAQLGSADLVAKIKSRRAIINVFIFLQAAMLLPMFAIALSTKPHIGLFILLAVLFTSFGAFAAPPWGSLMSDLVSEDKRGAYFGWRTRILGFVIVIATFIAGFILQRAKRFNVFGGFALLFASAFVFRIISWYFLTRMHEPRLEHKKEDSFTLLNFLARIRQSNFAKFTVFVSMMNFSVNLAAPFFPVLMLKDLNFSYILYSVITVTATLTIYSIIGRWGRLADAVGNIRIIKFVSLIISTVPLYWVINRNPAFLIFSQIIAGFGWAGFNLCTTNFVYDAVIPEKRTRCIAYFNVLNGVALAAGALIGGFLIRRLPPLFGYRILTLFLISSTLRTAVGFFLSDMLKEVRPVQEMDNAQLVYAIVGLNHYRRRKKE